MRFAIDAVWVDGDLTVIKISPRIAPWRTAACKGARGVVELAAGEAERRAVRTGDRLALRELAEAAPAANAA